MHHFDIWSRLATIYLRFPHKSGHDSKSISCNLLKRYMGILKIMRRIQIQDKRQGVSLKIQLLLYGTLCIFQNNFYDNFYNTLFRLETLAISNSEYKLITLYAQINEVMLNMLEE